MKISITPYAVGSAPKVIAGRETAEGPSGLRQNGVRSLRTAEAYRKKDVNVFDRKNLRNTFSFQVTRTFDTSADAEIFIMKHENEIPNVGLIKFEVQGENSSASFYMKGGVQSVDLVQQTGCTVVHAYSLVGGKILTQAPTT